MCERKAVCNSQTWDPSKREGGRESLLNVCNSQTWTHPRERAEGKEHRLPRRGAACHAHTMETVDLKLVLLGKAQHAAHLHSTALRAPAQRTHTCSTRRERSAPQPARCDRATCTWPGGVRLSACPVPAPAHRPAGRRQDLPRLPVPVQYVWRDDFYDRRLLCDEKSRDGVGPAVQPGDLGHGGSGALRLAVQLLLSRRARGHHLLRPHRSGLL